MKDHFKELSQLFSKIETEKEAEKLLKDILTPTELEQVAERWQLIKLLDAGLSQREIAKKLNISISKITRGSRVMQYGQGGFKLFLERCK